MIQYLLVLFLAQAAPHQSKFPTVVHKETIRNLLKTPDQAAEIKKMGPEGYRHLQSIMFSPDEQIAHRWNATLTLAKIGAAESAPDIDKALHNSVWYMRSAGLLAHSLITPDQGVSKAKEFLRRDPALLVRASALQVLAQGPTLDRGFLWAELYNPLNFNDGQSLSIRQSILKVLGRAPQKSETGKYVALMRENDSQIQEAARRSLETLYQRKAPPYMSKSQQLAFWQQVQ